jgi:mono/diheme cytochrome c family protein
VKARAAALSLVALAWACRSEAPPPRADAVQEAFRDGELSAREGHGRRVFLGRCATCHGPEGRGDGQNAYTLQPPPPDFRESLDKLPAGERRRIIEGGTAAVGRSALCPPWGRSLRGSEVDAVLAYLEVLASASADEDEEPGRRGWRRRR